MPMCPSVFYRGRGTNVRAGWRAQIHRGGKRLHSPRFDTKDDAEKWLAERVGPTEEQIGKPQRRLNKKTNTKTKSELHPGKRSRRFMAPSVVTSSLTPRSGRR